MDSSIIKSNKYKETLSYCLKINENNLKLPDYTDINQTLFKLISYDENGSVIFDDRSLNYGILLKTEFIFYLDDLYIGVFDNKYFVSFNESDLSFDFIGDNESNWLEEAFGWSFRFSDIFMKECFKEFGIPIKKFNPYSISKNFVISLSYKNEF